MIDLKPACNRMVEVLHRVTDDQLTNSSPCAEYTVADLIDHVDLVSRGSAALARQCLSVRTSSGKLGRREPANLA